MEPQALLELGISPALLTPSRSNGFLTLLQRMRKLATQLHKPLPSFPSLLIGPHATTPQGTFARPRTATCSPTGPLLTSLLWYAWCS